MALGRAFSVAVRGLEGEIVEIEADISSGLPGVHLVGLPDTALQESRDRVRAAITNCGNDWPQSRLTLALSPATLPKMGSVYDIALAAAVMSAHGKKEWERLEKTLLLGELALDGRVRAVKGVLPAVLTAKREGWPAVVVPVDNLREASLVDGVEVLGARTLGQLHAWLSGKAQLASRVEAATHRAGARCGSRRRRRADPRQVRRRGGGRRCTPSDAHGSARRRQNDAGATPSRPAAGVVAQRVARGHRDPFGRGSAVGRHPADHPAAVRGAPPHVQRGGTRRRRIRDGATGCGQPRTSRRALSRRVRRGRKQCARGIANALGGRRDSARAPRRRGAVSRPLPIGARGQPVPVRVARPARLHLCTSAEKRRYIGKLSGPLLDRVDLRVFMHREKAGAFAAEAGESTAAVRDRVKAARDAAAERWRAHGVRTNAEVSGVSAAAPVPVGPRRDGAAENRA